MALTRLAHQLVREHFNNQSKGLAVDGTCGNGHDTEFLARLGFEQVVAFDVQTQAIQNTTQRIQQTGLENVRLIEDGHQNLLDHLEPPISCAMFNFGYLPGADKSLTTESASSLSALHATLSALADNGLICLICYPGHDSGAIETKTIKEWLATLEQASVQQYLASKPTDVSPVLFTITP